MISETKSQDLPSETASNHKVCVCVCYVCVMCAHVCVCVCVKNYLLIQKWMVYILVP